jgi:hypothetical protein
MFTASFPPVDDLIGNLSKIEYKKHLNTLIHVVAFIAAVCVGIVSFIWKNASKWYQEGGKDDLRKVYKTIRNFCETVSIWVRVKGYPGMIQFFQEVQHTYRAWKDLVTV